MGEEFLVFWCYGVEFDFNDEECVFIVEVGDGKLYGDVEGVIFVNGYIVEEGFIIVFC